MNDSLRDVITKDTAEIAVDVNRWWKDLRGDDMSALKAIYECYSEQMLSYGLSIFKNRELVKDGIQEVFVDLWKYRKNLGETDNVKLYLFKALRTRVYRYLESENKSTGSYKGVSVEELECVESHESALISLERNEKLQKRLYEAMDQLPPRQKEVVRNIFFENLTYEDTSYLMSMNLRSVYTLVWKAISSLKKNILELLILLTGSLTFL